MARGRVTIQQTARSTEERMRPAEKTTISNRQLAELLALAGEKAEGYKRKAYFRAAHAAFVWPEEAETLLREERPLTDLPAIGPFLAREISSWINHPPETVLVPPRVRRNFLSLADARKILSAKAGWADRLKGDLQMHTVWSDGSATVAEMAEAGMARGYEYIGITDHTKELKIAGGINEEELARQGAEIAALNEAWRAAGKRFRVLRSAEVNLSPTGESDVDPRFATEELDIVLGSFHSKLRVKEDQTARYLAALENPSVQILGHPRGRVYNYREGLQADWRRVFARAAELDKAIEVDAYSDRQDIDLELLQIAREEGVRISFGSDSHHPWQLLFLDLALAATALAQIPPERIINFLPADELLRWVANLRRK